MNENNNNIVQQNNDVTVGDWLLTMFIMCVPIINFIMLLVWALGGSPKKSKVNYFRASIIFGLIIGAIYAAIFILFGSVIFEQLMMYM